MFAIREMTREDLEAVVAIITSHEVTDGELADEYYRDYFERNGAESDRERLFVGIVAATGEIAGVCGWYPDKYDWPDILWLNWTYVQAAFRGQGLGKMLLQHVIECVRQLDTRKLYVDTSSDRGYSRAVQMYERFGFREEGRLVDYYDIGEDYLILALDLSRQSPG